MKLAFCFSEMASNYFQLKIKSPRNNGEALLSPLQILATVSSEKEPKVAVSSFPMKNSVNSLAFMRCHVVATDSASPSRAVGLVYLYFIYCRGTPCSYKLQILLS